MLTIEYTGSDGETYTIQISPDDLGDALLYQGYGLVKLICRD